LSRIRSMPLALIERISEKIFIGDVNQFGFCR